MHRESEIQRAIILQLLRDDRPRRWWRAELARELGHLPAAEVGKAVAALAAEGVVERAGEDVWPSRPTRRLDALALIAV
jgi:hypothetical protein